MRGRLVAIAAMIALAFVVSAAPAIAKGCKGKTIKGTAKADTLKGTCGPDKILGQGRQRQAGRRTGQRQADRRSGIRPYPGHPGSGLDTVNGGPGSDTAQFTGTINRRDDRHLLSRRPPLAGGRRQRPRRNRGRVDVGDDRGRHRLGDDRRARLERPRRAQPRPRRWPTAPLTGSPSTAAARPDTIGAVGVRCRDRGHPAQNADESDRHGSQRPG